MTDQDTAAIDVWRSWWRQHCRSVSPRHRYAVDGTTATLCHHCNAVIRVGLSSRLLCDRCEALLRDQRV